MQAYIASSFRLIHLIVLLPYALVSGQIAMSVSAEELRVASSMKIVNPTVLQPSNLGMS